MIYTLRKLAPVWLLVLMICLNWLIQQPNWLPAVCFACAICGWVVLYYRAWKYYYWWVLIILFCLNLCYQLYHTPATLDGSTASLSGTVIRVQQHHYWLKTTNHWLVLISDFGLKFNHYELHLGDHVTLSGTLTKMSLPSNDYEFNYHDYLKHHFIYYQLKVNFKAPFTINHHFSLRLWLLQHWLVTGTHSYQLVFRFTFLQQRLSAVQPWIKTLSNVNLLHLFVVSGMHIALISWGLFFLTFKLCKNYIFTLILVTVFIGFYLYLMHWPLAALRAGLFFLLLKINRILPSTYQRSSLNLLAGVGLGFLIANPANGFDWSYLFSFTMTFAVISLNQLTTKYRPWKRWLIITGCLFGFSLPLNALGTNYLNFAAWINVVLFTPLSLGYYSLLFLLMYLPVTHSFLATIFKALMIIAQWLETWNWRLLIGAVPIWVWLSYYLTLTMTITVTVNFYRCCWLVLTISILVLVCNFFNLSPNFELHMLNVGNGQAILIQSPHHQSNILIDAGVDWAWRYRTSLITHYLQAQAVRHLDAIIITHHHQDHENQLTSVLTSYPTTPVIDANNINQINPNWPFGLKVLSQSYQTQFPSSDLNNHSLVLLLQFYHRLVLLTGDLEQEGEQALMATGYLPQVDFLQVPHHGSNSSSSIAFLEQTRPRISFISGRWQSNRRFPSPATLQRLKAINSKILLTNTNGTLTYVVKPNNQIQIQTTY